MTDYEIRCFCDDKTIMEKVSENVYKCPKPKCERTLEFLNSSVCEFEGCESSLDLRNVAGVVEGKVSTFCNACLQKYRTGEIQNV